MTTEPTINDVLNAVKTFGESYHDLHKDIAILRKEVASAQREGTWRGDQIVSLARKIDRQFDQAWNEIDQVREMLTALRDEMGALVQSIKDKMDVGTEIIYAHSVKKEGLIHELIAQHQALTARIIQAAQAGEVPDSDVIEQYTHIGQQIKQTATQAVSA